MEGDISQQDKEIIRVLQDEFPLVEEPYKELAARVGMSETEFLERVRRLTEEKKIRKIHEEEAIRKEKERDRERRKLQARHDREEEELIEQLRAKYERELAAQEEAIERKYQEQEAERIRQILAEKPAGRGGAKKVARKSDQ